MHQSETILSDARQETIESEEINEVVYTTRAAEDKILLSEAGGEIPEMESIQTIHIENEHDDPLQKLMQLWTTVKQKVEARRKEQKRDKFIASFFE